MYRVRLDTMSALMAHMTYQVYKQRDGKYGVTLSQLGATVRTAPGFTSVIDAQAWVEADARLANADNPFRECDPADPQGH